MRPQTQTAPLAASAAMPPRKMSTFFNSPELLGATMSFAKGAEIYGENEPADYVYMVVSGTVRSYRILNDGRRQIEGFHFAGDVFGLESGCEHAASAEAVTAATVLVIRRSAIMTAAERDQSIANQLWKLTARELDLARKHALLLVKSAQERVAAFLLDMARRGTGNAVELPMSRQDIADYLGLTIETVSRTLSLFQQEAAIDLPNSRRILLRDRTALNSLNA
jgi:CRP/FNR family transcriptional regulator, nitrogen fixation regulation protein